MIPLCDSSVTCLFYDHFSNSLPAYVVMPPSCQIGKQLEENFKRNIGLQPWGKNT